MDKTPIGWREWVYLPNLDIGPIKAKIDTGARTSALHASDVHVVDGDVTFKVHTIQGRTDFWIDVKAPLVEERLIRDSGGKATVRPIIETDLRLAGKESKVQLSLIDREDMTFRMLIGREALKDFAIDCNESYVGGVPPEIKNWIREAA